MKRGYRWRRVLALALAAALIGGGADYAMLRTSAEGLSGTGGSAEDGTEGGQPGGGIR